MKKNNFKICLLTTINEPLLPYYIESLLHQKLNNLVVICDSKLFTEHDFQVWEERTKGVFSNSNIYNYEAEQIPFHFVKNHNDATTQELIENLGVSVLLNAGTPRKLSTNIINLVKHGIINIHPGILPKYRGCSAVEWAILNDDMIGNTAHFMSENYDQGPIIQIERYIFSSGMDYVSIREKVYREGCALAGKVLKTVFKNNMLPSDGIIQDESLSRYWKPIPDDKFKEVLKKINEKNILFMNKLPYEVCKWNMDVYKDWSSSSSASLENFMK